MPSGSPHRPGAPRRRRGTARAPFRFPRDGTRFRLYLQSRDVAGFRRPSIVYVAARPGTIRPGPADARMYVVDALGKPPYSDEAAGEPRWRPPYPRSLPRRPPVRPGPSGHFDHLRPGTRAFSAAHAFATVRCVLAIWEHYLGGRIRWFFADRDQPRLEIIPRALTDNAWSSEGYLEFGFYRGDRARRFSENFDVVAHETGHLILKSLIGNPTNAKKTLEYRAHEESAADLVAVVSSLHFEGVVDRLLRDTRGRLFSRNVLSRIGEEGRRTQVRKAFNAETMWSPSVRRAERLYDKHGFSRPFTGGAFDVFVGIYERHLVRLRAMPASLARRSETAVAAALAGLPRTEIHRAILDLRRDFDAHFGPNRAKFREALLAARDQFARLLAATWRRTSVTHFSYAGVVAHMLAADLALTGGRHRRMIRTAFRRRGIVPARPGA